MGQNAIGSLQGEVQDTSGARIGTATVTVTDAKISIERTVHTNSYGEFRIDGLTPSKYHITVKASGFADANSDVVVQVSTARDVLVTLRTAQVQQTVNVKAEPSSITTQQLDTTDAVNGGVVSGQDLQTIPLAARSFANIAYMVPGTEPVEPSDPTKARITAVSTGGSSGLNNQLTVDGVDNSDDYIGGFLQNFSPDVIREFAVQTSQQDADIGRTTAGSVVISTRSGTNDWKGEAAVFERAAALNARFPIENPEPEPKQPFSRQNYVATLGGPIVKDKLWFFTGFEMVNEHASINYSPGSLAQFTALDQLAQQGLVPNTSSIDVPPYVRVPFQSYLGMVRLDWAQSQSSQWFLRYALDNSTSNNALVQQGTLPSTGATTHANYQNVALHNTFVFNPAWLGSFTFGVSYLHSTADRNGYLGFAMAFPFSSTSKTISGFETYGDNQFVTPITAFPIERNQEKYQFRYDVSGSKGRHAPKFGIDYIHEPVMSGAFPGTAETLYVLTQDPTYYLLNPSQLTAELYCLPPFDGSNCQTTSTPTSNGSFSQNVQRLGLYAMDTWRVTPELTVNYGLRWDTTFGLFEASGVNQTFNPGVQTIRGLELPLATGVPHDYRKAFAPRLGIAYNPDQIEDLVVRAGIGLYYSDLAQNGWATAFQAVNTPSAFQPCTQPGDPGCLPGAANGGQGYVIDPNYHTPYALHVSGGIQYQWHKNWIMSADYVHEQGDHGYRRYDYTSGYTLFSPLFPQDTATQQANVPNIALFKSDNRSSYNAMMLHVQGNITHRFNLTANYTLSNAKTWGCVLGELWDYVNGVCNPLNPFAPGDYGPSGEDVLSRFTLAGVVYVPGGFQVTTLIQAESGRPITLTTPVDVNGNGDPTNDRAVVNGVQTTLDQFRGTPYVQVDLRVTRPFRVKERWQIIPFVEFFNLFNRNNPGANYVTDISALPTPVNNLYNATALCPTPACNVPITSPNQLLVPAGALGDFFGPGTTVGIPFAAQLGLRVTF
ncbi:MAG TPA: carboxypeptidase regulatory-like domain-containing protein [Candidatus Angelobacter sp.]|nr:carboxypeptidase regulatory-like domain-containing protein [Candidatus Angelobacter sp.]